MNKQNEKIIEEDKQAYYQLGYVVGRERMIEFLLDKKIIKTEDLIKYICNQI